MTKVSDISNELGEDVSDDFKNAAQDASKLYAVIKQLTAVKANDFKGVSILTDTGAYKSTFEIIKEIANAWGQMTDINQAALLEQIAGKRQASAIAAIFQDPELLQKGEDYANSAAGATEKAMDVALDTVEVRMKRLQNEAQTFWQELVNSNGLKSLIDGLTSALDIVNKIVKASHGVLGGSGTAGLLGLVAGGAQSTFNKIRNGANSSGGAISFTGNGAYAFGVKLGRSQASKYSAVMDQRGTIYSADDIAIVDKIYQAYKKTGTGAQALNAAVKQAGFSVNGLNKNCQHLVSSLQNDSDAVGVLITSSKSLSQGVNAAGESMKAFGRVALSSLASGLLSAGISIGISALMKLIDNYVNRLDTAIDKGKEFSKSIQEQSNAYSDNEKQIESLRDEYDALARGVDEHGKNVSLTTDQYKRYKEIVSQIVQLAPSVAKGYSDENGYLVDRNKLIDDAIAKQKEYNAEVQQKRFGSEGFATEINGQLATAQQAKQSSIKGQLNWFEQHTGAPAIDTTSSDAGLQQDYDAYAEAQKDFLGNLKKAFDQSEQSNSETLDEYLQKQFGISGATVDNLTLISKSIDKITDGLNPKDSKAKSQLSSITSDLSRSAAKWVDDAETVDSVNKAIQDNFTAYVENAVDGYDKLNDAQKSAIKNSISNMTYADVIKGTKSEQDQSILSGTWEVDDEKRKAQQKKYEDMVKLLQNTASQKAISQASKIDTSLDYVSYEKQYKANISKLERTLNDVNKSQNLSLSPADIKQLVNITPVDQDGNDLHENPKAMADRLKATLKDGASAVDNMTMDQINVMYPVVEEIAEEHPGAKIELDQARQMLSLQTRIEELKNKSVASYGNLKTQVESYASAISGLNDITANNQIITTDMYNTLVSAGVSVQDLDSVVREFGYDTDGNTTYLVENIDKLKEFTSVANEAAKTSIAENIDVQRRRYAELLDQLDKVVTENYNYVQSNHKLTESRKDDVRSIQEQLDQTQDLLESYAALQVQVSATSQSYSAFKKAKEYDSRTDFGSEAIEMITELADDMRTATYGTEAFKAAMNAIVPKSALTNLDDANQKIYDTATYLKKLKSDGYLNVDSDGVLKGLNVDQFVQTGLTNGVFEGSEGNLRLNDTITSIDQVAQKFQMTIPMVQAFDEALKRAGTTGRSMFAGLIGDDTQNQIYRTLQDLNDAENDLQAAMNQGVDSSTLKQYKDKVDAVHKEVSDLASSGVRKRVSDYFDAKDQLNDLDLHGGSEGLRKKLEEQLNQKPTQLDVQLAITNFDDELKILQGKSKSKKLELYGEINHVDTSKKPVSDDVLNEWVEKRIQRDTKLKKQTSEFADDESNAAKNEMDSLMKQLDDTKSAIEGLTDAVKEDTAARSGDKSEGSTAKNKKETDSYDIDAAGANKTYDDIDKKNKQVSSDITNANPEFRINGSQSFTVLGQIHDAAKKVHDYIADAVWPEHSFIKSANAKKSKSSGKAKADGGTVTGESKALVGELGQELVVNPHTGKYYTVGDNGAEFVSLPKDAIVFNHLQTRQLLSKNHTGTRGTALASGNAYSKSKGETTVISPSGGNNGLGKTYDVGYGSSAIAKDAEKAVKASKKAAEKASKDWIEQFKAAADKLRENYASGKIDAEKYFDELTLLYQEYYKGYGQKSDENLKKLKDAWNSLYSSESSDLDSKHSNGEITERQYLDDLRSLYKHFYSDVNTYAKEHADAQKEFAQKAKSAYQNLLQAGSSVVAHRIKQLQNQMNGAVDALQKQKDAADRSYELQLRPLNAEIKRYEKLEKELNKQVKAKNKEQDAIEKVITAKNKEISAIQDASQARQTDLDLQKAQYNLAKAEHQRTQYTYTSNRGFVYRANPTDVKEARENLKEKQENVRVQQINNEIDALNKEKEAIQDEIDKIQEVIDRYSEHVDAIQEQIDAINDLKDATDQYYDDAIYNIQQQYQTQIDALQKIQDMWDQANDLFDFAESVQLLQSFGISLNDVTNNAGASIDLIKGKLADVLAYIYQNNDAAKEVWSTLLGIDLTKITPDIDNFALGIKGISDYAGTASGNVRTLNGDLAGAQLFGVAAQGGIDSAANAVDKLGSAAATTSPRDLAATMAQLSATDLSGFNTAVGTMAANSASLEALNTVLTQTLGLMQGLGGQDVFGNMYNQFAAFVTNFEALAAQFQQDMTALFGQGQAAGNDKSGQSAGWFDGFVNQVEDMNERTSAALQNQIEQWTTFQQLMVGVLGVGGGGQGNDKGQGQGQQGGGVGASGAASANSIIGSLTLAATDMNEAFGKWEETLNEFITGTGGFTDFTNQVMTLITNMSAKIQEQCNVAIDAINSLLNQISAANAAIQSMSVPISGAVNASGTTHPANAAGSTGLPRDEHHALVGELGPEIVVSGDKYRVVGQHGAEFTDLKRGDIVLNHIQTAKAFKNGVAHANGFGNLIPAAQPAFMAKLSAVAANIKQISPKFAFAGVNAASNKLATPDGTNVVINDLHVSLPNFNSDKADDLIRDLSSMTLKAVQRYNRH